VWLVVIGTHGVVFFWLGTSGQRVERERGELIVDVALTLVPEWIEPPTPDETGAPTQTPAAVNRRRRDTAPESALPADPPLSTAPTPDWHAAAERAAQRATSGNPNQTHLFVSPESPYRDCQRRKNNFEWKPDAHRTGWANGLPYVRMGKRCVVGLGFFGCALDPELPPPDGELFEDMGTANQMDGSVPGAQDCVVAESVPPAR
jgi:hypothetical protein